MQNFIKIGRVVWEKLPRRRTAEGRTFFYSEFLFYMSWNVYRSIFRVCWKIGWLFKIINQKSENNILLHQKTTETSYVEFFDEKINKKIIPSAGFEPAHSYGFGSWVAHTHVRPWCRCYKSRLISTNCYRSKAMLLCYYVVAVATENKSPQRLIRPCQMRWNFRNLEVLNWYIFWKDW